MRPMSILANYTYPENYLAQWQSVSASRASRQLNPKAPQERWPFLGLLPRAVSQAQRQPQRVLRHDEPPGSQPVPVVWYVLGVGYPVLYA